MARDGASADGQYASLARRVSSLESQRNKSVDQAISQVGRRVDNLARQVENAQGSLRRLKAEFQEHQAGERKRQKTLAAGRRKADNRTAAVDAELQVITDILLSGVPSRQPTFDELLRRTETVPFNPGRLGVPPPAPQWQDFAPPPPGWLQSKLGGARRHERQTEDRRGDYEEQKTLHEQQEAKRLKELRAAQLRHETDAARQRAADDAWNAEVERARAGFRACDPEAISWLVRQALGASKYPDWWPCDKRQYEVICQLGAGDILIELELPPASVIPGARRYEYQEDTARCVALPRPRGEVALLYSGLIASIALRTVSEVLTATAEAAEVIHTVTVNARARGTEATTGIESRPQLLIMSVRRGALDHLILPAVQPLACAAHLGARISPDPLTPVPA